MIRITCLEGELGKWIMLPRREPTGTKSLKRLYTVERDLIIEVYAGIRARLRNAGHILGSSILELWVEEKCSSIKTVFFW